MDKVITLSTTTRHNELVGTFFSDLLALRKRKEVYALYEECPLVYWGKPNEEHSLGLVEIETLKDTEYFRTVTIEELSKVQPDLMVFMKDNPFLKNDIGTRTAGRPDLVIEVWSEGNSDIDKNFKKNLYSTSEITEHWYVEQDSNAVDCYLGQNKIAAQDLRNILVTVKNIKFDLKFLAL